jgi:hypothetical protein
MLVGISLRLLLDVEVADINATNIYVRKKMKEKIKKIQRWFKLQPDKELEVFHFQKDEEGKDVFYPWGCPGESYYINANQKKQLKNLIYFMRIFSIISIPIIFLYYELTHEGQYKFNWIIVLAVTAYLIIHFIIMYFFTRKFGPNIQKEDAKIKSGKGAKLKELFAITVIQIALVFLGLLYNPQDDLLKVSGLFVIVFYPTLIFFFWFRGGYIFQKG